MLSTIELLLIIFLSIFQSIFGVGLLFVGTPVFLLLGHSFGNTLELLLPLSITISFFQFFFSEKKQKFFIKTFNFFCLPVVFLTTLLIFSYKITFKIEIAVSFVLIFFAIINLFKINIHYSLHKKTFKFSLILLGLIHGATNLGGSFLTIISSRINKNKNSIRECVAYGYLAMGIVQLFAIYYLQHEVNFTKLLYIIIPLLVYFPSQFFFKKLKPFLFIFTLNFLALVSGMYILLKYFNVN